MSELDRLMEDLGSLKSIAKGWKTRNKRSLAKLRGSKDLDRIANTAHSEVFATIDCMDCANCCKTTGPLFRSQDINQLAHYFKISPVEFIERYLYRDEDGDLVLKSLPCPFLGSDNGCTVYDIRPKACRTYPHTDSRNQAKIFDLTLQNAEICPAVLSILQRITKRISAG